MSGLVRYVFSGQCHTSLRKVCKKMLGTTGGERVTTKTPKSLPKVDPLPGVVCPQFVRCGTPGCKCATGDLHGPYWYRFWRERGTLRKAYVRPAHVEEIRAACALYHHDRRLM